MIFKYIILDRVNGKEKIVTGATQAREAIKDLLTFNDIAMLLVMKYMGVREIVNEHPPISKLTKIIAEWIVSHLRKDSSDYLPKMDFENFSIEVEYSEEV